MQYKSLIFEQIMSPASAMVVSSMRLINRATTIHQESITIARIKGEENTKKVGEKLKKLSQKQSPPILPLGILTKLFFALKIPNFQRKSP